MVMFVSSLFSWIFLGRMALTTCQNWTYLDLTDNCPHSYRILGTASSPGTETDNANEGNEACWDLAKKREVPGSTALSHLCPELNIGFPENNTVVNITWNTDIKDSLYPSQYLLELTRHKKAGGSYILSKTCILLQVRNQNFKQSKALTTIFFDCVKVAEEKDLFLNAQAWRVLTRLDTESFDAGPATETECTEDNNIPLSLDFYIPRICHCSGLPKLSLERLANGSFQITVWNLPRFTYKIDIHIYESNRHDAIFYKHLPGTSQVNENRTVVTEEKYGPGNYSLVVDAACPGDYDDLLHLGVTCPLMDPVQLEYSLEVPTPPESKPAVIQHNNYFMVLACALVTGSICLVTVYAWLRIRKRRKNDRIEKHCEEKELLEVTTLNNTIEPNRHPNLGEPKHDILLIYYPDNDKHINKVNKLKNILQDNFGAHVVFPFSTSSEVFSRSKSSEYTDIIIVISEGLYDVCKNYRVKATDDLTLISSVDNNAINGILEIFDTLHMQSKVEFGYAVHFVSFGLDSILTEKFKENIDFPKSKVNQDIHDLNIDIDIVSDNEKNMLIPDIMKLAQNLAAFAGEVRDSGRDAVWSGEKHDK